MNKLIVLLALLSTAPPGYAGPVEKVPPSSAVSAPSSAVNTPTPGATEPVSTPESVTPDDICTPQIAKIKRRAQASKRKLNAQIAALYRTNRELKSRLAKSKAELSRAQHELGTVTRLRTIIQRAAGVLRRAPKTTPRISQARKILQQAEQ